MKQNLDNSPPGKSTEDTHKKIRKRKYLLYAILIIWVVLLFIILTR